MEDIAGVQLMLYGIGWIAGAALIREERKVLAHWAAYALLQAGATVMANDALTAARYPGALALIASMAGFAVAARGIDIFCTASGLLGRQLLLFTLLPMTVLIPAQLLPLSPEISDRCRAIAYDIGLACIELGPLRSLWLRLRQAHSRFATTVTLAPMALSGALILAALGIHLSLGPQQMGDAREVARVPNVIASLVMSAMFNFGFLFLLLARLIGRLRHSAQHDYLTGCLNRRAIEGRVRQLWEQHRRSGKPLCIALFDIDHFKLINDRYGHAAGDRTLCLVAEVLGNLTRPYDLLGRWGGEEFMLVLPDTEANVARDIVDRLRRALSSAGRELESASLTVSAGLACMDTRIDTSLDHLIERADQAMYRAKEQGRDRVECAVA